VKVEHQNRRRDRENAIAERRYTADLFTGYSVLVGLHGVTIALGLKRVNPSGDDVIAVVNALLPNAV
jgi:hypothetical protein